jgi:peptide-methionine (R)-S-oxide reductase
MSTERSSPSSALSWNRVLELAERGNVPPPRRVEKTDAEWRAQLTEEQYHVARRKGTERAFSSELCGLFEPGRYHCICCDTPLFDSTTKFESRTGWPSFTEPLAPDVVAYHSDSNYGMQRIETVCNVCDAHLGHVFPDGPPPTGLRFCINAVSLRKKESVE